MITKKLPKKIKVKERKLGREKAAGLSWESDALVELDPRQSEKERLDTLVHESLHILFSGLSEMAIRGISPRITEAIWKDGWRRVRGL
jgi:uncharacterized DUF497 family protein